MPVVWWNSRVSSTTKYEVLYIMEKMFDSPGLLIALICALAIVGALVAVLGKTLYKLMDLFTAQAKASQSSVSTTNLADTSSKLVAKPAAPLKHCCWHCGQSLADAVPINEIALSEAESYLVYRCPACAKTQAVPAS